jgi:hypothetical protein
MIELSWVVQLNNMLCLTACALCFLHGLHGSIYTSLLTKTVLFGSGICFYSSVVTIEQVIMPGYIYIFIANAFICLLSISFFIVEAYRSGCLTSWVALITDIFTGGLYDQKQR